VNSHTGAVKKVKDTAAEFQSSHHFMGDEIQERSFAVITRSVIGVCRRMMARFDVMCDWWYMNAYWRCRSALEIFRFLLLCLSYN
jgi:hypothetical protein